MEDYQPGIILLMVRWYLRYTLSFYDLMEMMEYMAILKFLYQNKFLVTAHGKI
ncbi:hypothetical protein FH5_00168 [Priestia endophytica]|nr:hypothetical protein FH5_00168 [Priestia endophytica]